MVFSRRQAVNQADQSPIKRGRGRPRKVEASASAETGQVDKPSRFKTPNKKTALIALVLIIVAALPSIYFYNKSKDTAPADANAEVQQLVKKVGKHALLPDSDTPTLLTLTNDNITRLGAQSFFSRAQAGDKVLVYTKNGRAILYRPSIDKIIEMAPLNSESNPPAQ